MGNAPSDGSVRKMYHGTSRRRGEQIVRGGFKPSRTGMLGPGVYVSDNRKKVLIYARNTGEEDGSGWCILVLNVDVGRVKKINRQGHPLQYTWMMNGYDTAWVPPNCGMVPSGLSENCVADPKRITVIAVDYQNYVIMNQYPRLRTLPREKGLTPDDMGRHDQQEPDEDVDTDKDEDADEDETNEEKTDEEETDEEETDEEDVEEDTNEDRRNILQHETPMGLPQPRYSQLRYSQARYSQPRIPMRTPHARHTQGRKAPTRSTQRNKAPMKKTKKIKERKRKARARRRDAQEKHRQGKQR